MPNPVKRAIVGQLASLMILSGLPAVRSAELDDDPQFAQYGIYQQTAPRASRALPRHTKLPLVLAENDRIMLVGNTLLERSQHFGYLEALLQQRFPNHRLVVRNLAWSADTPDLQPRPANFADIDQHLTHERADVIIAAFGFNESFEGETGMEPFRASLEEFVDRVRTSTFNGQTPPQIILLSPIANENIAKVDAAEMNNQRIKAYSTIVRSVAQQMHVAYVDLFESTRKAMDNPASDLTINGVHLTDHGYKLFANSVYRALFNETPPAVNQQLRMSIVDKNRQYFRRYRPANTFYYTGDRNKSYGYLDFLPAMRNFDLMVANRDQRIWDLAQGKSVPDKIDDSNVPPLPRTQESRAANRWMSADDERKSFRVDPRFEVNLFACEEQFPDIAAPIQIRWDSMGRLWVSCSTTYPHVYPGNEPNDKLVILEDTDADGRADKSTVFADDLHIPLSFEFGNGAVYVSEMPHLTFLKDTDGDGRADHRRRLLTGFGTEDSHHSLHDMVWTPDGDLMFREGVFHHSQIETPYGPVRQQNSGWFRFRPNSHRLVSFGTYSSTNPWGVTFDAWGRHVASHPIFASAFHALDPPYPQQHPRPTGLQAYSGTCGQEFVDFATFPADLQGSYIKVRYKPTNRVEIHEWYEDDFGCDERYVGDLIFSTNLSFIPVDIRFGPRGALYICDWYNPIKGHAQYSLRDERRDRHSGRIWRITARGHTLQMAPRIANASVAELLELLKRPEYRYRYWAKRELREHDPDAVEPELNAWLARLDPQDPRYHHQQVEALWMYRNIGQVNTVLLRSLLTCQDHRARAAATQQLRYWHPHLPDAIDLLRSCVNDPHGLVRMEAVIAASYIGSREALMAALDVFKHPHDRHLTYAITTSLGSWSLKRHWQNDSRYDVERLLRPAQVGRELKEPTPSASQAEFDHQKDLKVVQISCQPERMKYTVETFAVETRQPVKIVFTNPDATDHNLVIVQPNALEEVGMAANEMAKDPRNANSDFIPASKKHLILQASPMIGPTRRSKVHVFRFIAPASPGVYPFVCTFPGHWVVMKGQMVVADDPKSADLLLAAQEQAPFVKNWVLKDFSSFPNMGDENAVMRGSLAFQKAKCDQCHVVAGHGIPIGPDLSRIGETYHGDKLMKQILEPSSEINKDFRTYVFELKNGTLMTGVIQEETESKLELIPNLLNPESTVSIDKKQIHARTASRVSSMPEGMMNVLTKQEALDVIAYLQAGGYNPPKHLKHRAHSP